MNDEYKAKIFLGELTLGDLWEMGLLEGMMKLDENERITAGKKGDSVEFCNQDGIVRAFPYSCKVKLNSSHLPAWAIEFKQHTLILARDMENFIR